MNTNDENPAYPLPYRGARKLLSEGLPAARAAAVAPAQPSIIDELISNCADILTVELFGNQTQRDQVHAWMENNRNRSQR